MRGAKAAACQIFAPCPSTSNTCESCVAASTAHVPTVRCPPAPLLAPKPALLLAPVSEP